MSKLDKDQVISAFTEAYTKANGKAPTIEAKGGWYSVDGAKNVRLAELNDQIAELGSAKSATPAEKPKKAAATKKPAAEKPAAKKPAASKKAAPKAKKAKAKNSGFSVKAFWAEKIQSDNAGSKLPR